MMGAGAQPAQDKMRRRGLRHERALGALSPSDSVVEVFDGSQRWKASAFVSHALKDLGEVGQAAIQVDKKGEHSFLAESVVILFLSTLPRVLSVRAWVISAAANCKSIAEEQRYRGIPGLSNLYLRASEPGGSDFADSTISVTCTPYKLYLNMESNELTGPAYLIAWRRRVTVAVPRHRNASQLETMTAVLAWCLGSPTTVLSTEAAVLRI
jgi:hypothetical protein